MVKHWEFEAQHFENPDRHTSYLIATADDTTLDQLVEYLVLHKDSIREKDGEFYYSFFGPIQDNLDYVDAYAMKIMDVDTVKEMLHDDNDILIYDISLCETTRILDLTTILG